MSWSPSPKAITCPETVPVYEYTFVISRGGQRTPTTACTLLPQTEPQACGQLTAVGCEQLRRLGRLLKTHYSALLTGQSGEVLASHTKHRRSYDSAYIVLEAMDLQGVKPVQDHTDYTGLYESNVVTHYEIIMMTLCRGLFVNIGDMINFVCKKTGCSTSNHSVKFMCLDSLITYVANGNPIPDWALPHWDNILWADRTLFEMSMAGCEKRMAVPVLKQVLDTLIDQYENHGTRKDKMHLFLVSDTILFSILKLLNCFYDARPSFCATLLIEVYHREDGETPQVQVLFANTVRPILLRLDWMANPCSVTTFIAGLRRILSSDYTYNVRTGRTWPVPPSPAETDEDDSATT